MKIIVIDTILNRVDNDFDDVRAILETKGIITIVFGEQQKRYKYQKGDKRFKFEIESFYN